MVPMDKDKAKLYWGNCPFIESDPEVVSGAWVFKNTRFQASIIFMALARNESVEEIPQHYVGDLTRQQVADLLNWVADSLEVDILKEPHGKISTDSAG